MADAEWRAMLNGALACTPRSTQATVGKWRNYVGSKSQAEAPRLKANTSVSPLTTDTKTSYTANVCSRHGAKSAPTVKPKSVTSRPEAAEVTAKKRTIQKKKSHESLTVRTANPAQAQSPLLQSPSNPSPTSTLRAMRPPSRGGPQTPPPPYHQDTAHTDKSLRRGSTSSRRSVISPTKGSPHNKKTSTGVRSHSPPTRPVSDFARTLNNTFQQGDRILEANELEMLKLEHSDLRGAYSRLAEENRMLVRWVRQHGDGGYRTPTDSSLNFVGQQHIDADAISAALEEVGALQGQLSESQQQVSELERLVTDLQATAYQKESIFSAGQQSIEQLQTAIQALEQTLEANQAAHNLALEENEHAIEELKASLEIKDAVIVDQKRCIQQLEASLRANGALLEEQKGILRQMEEDMVLVDPAMRAKELVIAEQESRIRELELMIEEYRRDRDSGVDMKTNADLIREPEELSNTREDDDIVVSLHSPKPQEDLGELTPRVVPVDINNIASSDEQEALSGVEAIGDTEVESSWWNNRNSLGVHLFM
ncbi:uncharacterized protein SPPG_08103 [Spizellomyces punctatus DAOM BR117]|uniref:Uncharacterized protein n=1 Tax=Spizellomyces punctatus (strain DAOM BR117) TaxID=645134 RepID=A0A0L0H6B5_SPIPD|nr:uncharacterized protein SPPG_08103 [Spizellomyces punctatus DAOM BR117]KNC96514.1 hypothetical protein SPPG_08103 [Spizellomyces punctatus DAOM BR117]|eukprot:XP_016604554.1 hypothetical protein SPPG_08103 [Spizellomyces punctatus DAOM BR117]